MTKPAVLILAVAFAAASSSAEAQGIRNKLRPNEVKVKVENADAGRNDLEGVIWEYKVLDAKTKKTQRSGTFRIKGTAVFAILEASENGDGKDQPVRAALADRIRAKNSGDVGDERIGDVVYDKSDRSNNPIEITIRFDEDDKHELSGIAVVKRDTKNKGGVWLGRYDDEEDHRWRFEMRSIEE